MADFLRAYRFHRNRYARRWLWSLLQLFLIALLGAAVLIYVLTRAPYPNPIAVPLVVAGLMWVLYRMVSLTFWPYLHIPSRRRIRRGLDKLGESTVDLDETGARQMTAQSSSVIGWDGFRGYAESKHAFLLYLTDSQFAIIPKETLTAAVCDRIRALVSVKLRPR